MNIRILFAIIFIATFTTSCGMKRGLTLPSKSSAEQKQASANIPQFHQELANFDSIDILKPLEIKS